MFEKHKGMLEGALSAIELRTYWTPFPEMPSGKIYGETAKDDFSTTFPSTLFPFLRIIVSAKQVVLKKTPIIINKMVLFLIASSFLRDNQSLL